MLNHLLMSVRVLSEPIDFLGNSSWTMFSMILVGVFVSRQPQRDPW